MHYVAGGGIESNGQYTAGTAGFNLADVQSLEQLNALPEGVKGLVWLDKAEGVTSEFIATVSQYIGNGKLWGFYLADEPDPTGQWGTKVSAADLKAESDWIHANVPGAKTFIVMMNMGMTSDPTYMNTYNPANTGIDYYGLDPYPIRTGGNIDLSSINKNVEAAIKAGIPLEAIVPVYQAFGGGGWSTDTGGKYVMPTSAQMKAMIDHWETVVPDPAFDYAYHWESQNGDQALSTNSALLDVFRQHNAATDPAPPPVIETLPPVTEPVHPPADGSGSTAGSGTGTTPPVTEPTTPSTGTGSTAGSGTGTTPPVTEPTDPGTGSGSTAGSGTGTTPPVTEPTPPSTGTGSTAGSGTGTTPPVTEPTTPVVDTGSTGGGGRGHGGKGGHNKGDGADSGHKFAQKFVSADSFKFSDAASKFAERAASADTTDFITKISANGRSQFVDKLAALGLTADVAISDADASAQNTASVDASPPSGKMAHHQHFAWDHLWG
ncbi:MAG: calcium-binding protein [Proteobacteria bacterium]|nr:calcium-binding protein [Pseudomonadota bacterium]